MSVVTAHQTDLTTFCKFKREHMLRRALHLSLNPGYAPAEADGPILRTSLLAGHSSQPTPVDVGATGVTASALRPSGKAMFGDKYLDVVSDGAYIDHGTAIEVIRVAGNRIVVRSNPGTQS